jgi:dihydroorotase
MVGLETAFSVVVKTMIESKLMSWTDLIDRMSVKPAQIAGYKQQGQVIAENSPANLILVDTASSWQVERNNLKSKSKNTPFNGMNLPAVISDVIYNGKLVLSNRVIVNGNHG